MKNELRFRLDNYEKQELDYTVRRYSLDGMKYYSKVRSIKINKLIENNVDKINAHVLDVGCGTCVLMDQIAKLNKNLVFTGLDFSPRMLDNNVLSPSHKNKVELVRGSAFEMPFADSSFDAVISSRFIHQYSDSKKADLLREMERVLKPGGLLIVEFYSNIPAIIKNPFRILPTNANNEFMEHYTSKRTLDSLYKNNYLRVPLVAPLPKFLVKFGGIDFFTQTSKMLEYFELDSFFQQYLVITRKGK